MWLKYISDIGQKAYCKLHTSQMEWLKTKSPFSTNKLEAEPHKPSRQRRDQGSDSTGTACALPPPPLPPSTSPTPSPRKQRTQCQERSPSSSSRRSSDCSDSSVGWSPYGLHMTGHEPEYLHKSFLREYRKNQKLKVEPRNSARQRRSQGSESTGKDSAIPPLPSTSSTPSPCKQRTQGQDHSPVTSSARSSDCSDSSVGWSPFALQMMGQEPRHLHKTFYRVYKENECDQFDAWKPSKSPRLKGRQRSVSDKNVPPPSLAEYKIKYKPKAKKRLEYLSDQMSPQTLGSSEMGKKTLGGETTTKTEDAGTESAADDTEADAEFKFYARFAKALAGTDKHSKTKDTTELLELMPVKTKKPIKNAPDLLLGAEQPAMTKSTAMVGPSMPQLVELVPTDAAKSPLVQSSMETATAGPATPQLVELVPTDAAAHPSVLSPTATATVGPAMPQLVELVQSDGATSDSVQRLNSLPRTLLPTNETDKPTASKLPLTSNVNLVGVTAPLTYQLPGAQQDARVKSVGPVTMTRTTDILTKSPYRLYPYPLPPTYHSACHSVNQSMLPISSTHVGTPYPLQFAVSQQTISAEETTAAGSAMTGAVRFTSTFEATYPASNFCRQCYPDSSTITGAVRSAPKVETTYLPSNFCRHCFPVSPVTNPTYPPASTTTSGAQTTSTSTVDISMMSNLSNFRTSVAQLYASRAVGRSIVSNVTHTQPVANPVAKFRDGAGINQGRTTSGDTRRLSERFSLMTMLLTAPRFHTISYYSSSLVSSRRNNWYLNTTQRTQLEASTPSIDVSMLSNLVEFHASTGAQRRVFRMVDNTAVSSDTRREHTARTATTKAMLPSIEKESALMRSSTNQSPPAPSLPSTGIGSVQNGQQYLPTEHQSKQQSAVTDESELNTQPNEVQPLDLSCSSTSKQQSPPQPGFSPRRQLPPPSAPPYGIERSMLHTETRPLLAQQFIGRRPSPGFPERPPLPPQFVSTPPTSPPTGDTVAPYTSAGNTGEEPQCGTVKQYHSDSADVPETMPVSAGGTSCNDPPQESSNDAVVPQSVSPAPGPAVADNGSDTRAHHQE